MTSHVDRTHRLHAHAVSGKGGRSFELGGWRWRPDGAGTADPRAVARRAVFVWNMAEGIPTAALEAGAVRQFYEAVGDLLDAVAASGQAGVPSSIAAAAAKVSAAWDAHRFDFTDGRRADCPCSERVGLEDGRRAQLDGAAVDLASLGAEGEVAPERWDLIERVDGGDVVQLPFRL